MRKQANEKRTTNRLKKTLTDIFLQVEGGKGGSVSVNEVSVCELKNRLNSPKYANAGNRKPLRGPEPTLNNPCTKESYVPEIYAGAIYAPNHDRRTVPKGKA